MEGVVTNYHDGGGASRFFYCPKVSKKERNFGCDGLEDKERKRVNAGGLEHDPKWAPVVSKNNDPTVKPIALMRYLIRLITPPGEICMDPFLGSGSTGMAAVLEGRDFIGIEMSEDYLEIAKARIEWAKKEASNG
jgi:site-specific DNA-methyltransferase (adenine-specific)